jgi:C4-dicarboxylate transporter DctQ subunit
MAVVVTMQVIWRYFLGNPLVWAEELARYALVWMTFIGAAVALRAGQLAAMDLVVTRFPPKVQKHINFLASLASCVLLAFLFYCSVNLVGMPSVLMQKSPAMRLPMSYVYMALPLGLGLLLLQSILALVSGLCRKGE